MHRRRHHASLARSLRSSCSHHAPLAAGMLAVALATTSGVHAGGEATLSLVGQWDGGGSYADVWGDGDYAYVAHFGDANLDIIDISDPTAPTRVVAYHLPPPNESASAQDVKVADGLCFIGLEGSGNSVHILDVRNPTEPVPLVDIAIGGMTAIHNVFYADGYLYIVDSGSPRIGIVDLTTFDPDNPPKSDITTVKWMMEGVGSSFVHDITVVDGRMYACAWDSGIWIYDVTNVADAMPEFLASGPGNNTHSAWPTSDGRYVITGEERSEGGIVVYRHDEGDPSLTITDSFTLPAADASSVHNQYTIGYRVYNSWYAAGVLIFDVAPDTGLLSFVAEYDTPSAWGIYPALGDDRILVSDIPSGLYILDLDAPLTGDIDGDGVVGVSDLLALLAAWGDCTGPCAEDLDGDGAVSVSDLLILLAHWS